MLFLQLVEVTSLGVINILIFWRKFIVAM
jgi:hypothetical protein